MRESLARGMRSSCMQRDQAVRQAITALDVARYNRNLTRPGLVYVVKKSRDGAHSKTKPGLNVMRGRRLFCTCGYDIP